MVPTPLPDRAAPSENESPGDGSVRSRPARYDRRGPSAPAVSVIVPTYNEVENLPLLVAAVSRALLDFDYEIVVVDDDSPDGTWRVAEELAAEDRRVRVIRRIGRRGLSSAVLEGMGSSEGRVLAVIDADLQHDEAILPDLVSAVLDDEVDVCLGSREVEGGSYGQFGPVRRLISWVGAIIARRLVGVAVTDPMSGFFAVSRLRYDHVVADVNPRGFKILLELLARGDRPRVAEVGYRFRNRVHGHTKLTGSVVLAYLAAIVELTLARLVNPVATTYATMAVTALCLRISLIAGLTVAGAGWWASAAAIETAIVAEFLLHDRWTFGAEARRGRWSPLARFHLVAGYGLLAHVGLGTLVERHLPARIGTGAALGLLAAAGLLVVTTTVVGYLLNRQITWAAAGGSVVTPPGAGQTRRPTTVSTSSMISPTARR